MIKLILALALLGAGINHTLSLPKEIKQPVAVEERPQVLCRPGCGLGGL